MLQRDLLIHKTIVNSLPLLCRAWDVEQNNAHDYVNLKLKRLLRFKRFLVMYIYLLVPKQVETYVTLPAFGSRNI